MRLAGLQGRRKKRWRKTTAQDPAASATDLNLIQGAFDVGGDLDVSYCGDITYTPGGWAHLATVIDISSRRVVGWALADHMRTELVRDAPMMAFGSRMPPKGSIFHSDRGCDSTSKDCRNLARDHRATNGAKPSLNRVRALPIRSWWVAAITNHRQARTGDRC
jgi:transposase InsO family protein